MTKKADKLPTPVEVLKEERIKDEEELNKLREDSMKPQAEEDTTETEELAEESLPSEDEGKSESEELPDQRSDEAEDLESGEQEPELSERGRKRFEQLSKNNRELIKKLEEKDTLLARREEEYKNLAGLVDTLQDQGYTRQEAEAIAPQMDQQFIDPRRYQQDVARQAQVIVEQTLHQREQQQLRKQSAERFQEDLNAVEKKYDELNEDSPEYNEKLALFVSDVYSFKNSQNPQVRLTDVVEEVMTLREQAAEDSTKRQVDKIRRQASRQAMSPNGGKTETSSIEKRIQEADSPAELERIRKEIGTNG